MLVVCDSVHDSLNLTTHFGPNTVDRRVVDSDPPIGGRPTGQANLSGLRWCMQNCSGFLIWFRSCLHTRHDFTYDSLSTSKLSVSPGSRIIHERALSFAHRSSLAVRRENVIFGRHSCTACKAATHGAGRIGLVCTR